MGQNYTSGMSFDSEEPSGMFSKTALSELALGQWQNSLAVLEKSVFLNIWELLEEAHEQWRAFGVIVPD